MIEGETDRTIVDPFTGAADHGIVDALSADLEAAGWTVEYQDLTGGRNGYSDPEGQHAITRNRLRLERAASEVIDDSRHAEGPGRKN